MSLAQDHVKWQMKDNLLVRKPVGEVCNFSYFGETERRSTDVRTTVLIETVRELNSIDRRMTLRTMKRNSKLGEKHSQNLSEISRKIEYLLLVCSALFEQ